jgi:DNA-binding XRE family transcriptional regulator
MTNLERIREGLSPTRRKKIAARVAELAAEEMTLRDLRQTRKRTQRQLAKDLGMSQDGISKLEKRTDCYLSTMRHYVEAMGGHLSLVAEFPDRDPIIISGFAALDSQP